MKCKTGFLYFWLTLGIGSYAATFGDWLKLMNNKTRSASEDLNRLIDKTKVDVGEHLIGSNLGRPVSINRNDGQMTSDGRDNSEEINLFDEKMILDESNTFSGFGLLGSEDGLFVESDDESDKEVLLWTSKNKTRSYGEHYVVIGEQHLEAPRNQSSSSTLTTPIIIGISSAGCLSILIIVTLSILAISSKKKQFGKQENVSSTEANQYDRGYGKDVGYDNGGTDGGFYQGGRSDYYPVI